MRFDAAAVRKCLKSFDFNTLFREHLGWDKHQSQLDIPIDGTTITLNAVAETLGFVAYLCSSIPDRAVRLKIDHQVTKSAREHFIIYADKVAGQQVWQWVRRETGKPIASRDHRFDVRTTGDALIQRIEAIAFSMKERESLTLPVAVGRGRKAFDVDTVTKKFYDRFQKEHAAFLTFIKGIKAQGDLEWYTSLMLNRLMFVYFIQKKGFLDGDTDYLQNRMRKVRDLKGKDKFHSFYRYFLVRLFHDGLGKHETDRQLDAAFKQLLGKVPYLNGGFFEVHQIEERCPEIDIPDQAFEKLFAFFDEFRWHLDEPAPDRPLRAGNEINPDVVGYIFEKYINQKQMGAYYTKEDITEYISKNTIIPFLFDAAEKKCAVAFKPDSFLWKLLRDDPDRYIYPAVRQGVIDAKGDVIELPAEIAAGVADVAKRGGWNKPAKEPFALPAETWREHVARRQRCMELREKLKKGEVHQINDLVTLNLDIWQFARDAIVNSEGPELLRAFWQAIAKVTVLDPTCGSGAFLFAALRILETLYSDCIERMERFREDLAIGDHHPEKYKDFKDVLAQLEKHPSDRYFILKSIIIGNLYGVDIMEEAVEICKLRLFLKLVAQVETAEQIEPLPDIDFNIRAGNTLVGYVSLDEIRKAAAGVSSGGLRQELLVDSETEEEIKRIEDELLLVEKSYDQFRAQQTKHGGKVTPADKLNLRERLKKLDAELDRYLAEAYLGKDFKAKAFDAWKASHQPFHWMAEFYGTMNAGGFDVIIGNPPYVEYSKVRDTYAVRGFKTVSCGNLYVLVLEQSAKLCSQLGRLGLIVPLSLVCTDRMSDARGLLKSGTVWLSSYDIRPASLFTGIAQRLTILIHAVGCGVGLNLKAGGYRRWAESERASLLPLSQFVDTSWMDNHGPIAKVSQRAESSILKKMHGNTLATITDESANAIYIHRICRYFIKCLDFIPYFRDADGNKGKSEDYKRFTFRNDARDAAICFVNSTLFYWFWRSHGDGFHCGYADVYRAPFRVATNDSNRARYARLSEELMAAMKANSENKKIRTKKGEIVYQEFSPKPIKGILDEIDNCLAQDLNLAPEELDFIINYDIKYRMGQHDAGDDDE